MQPSLLTSQVVNSHWCKTSHTGGSPAFQDAAGNVYQPHLAAKSRFTCELSQERKVKGASSDATN